MSSISLEQIISSLEPITHSTATAISDSEFILHGGETKNYLWTNQSLQFTLQSSTPISLSASPFQITSFVPKRDGHQTVFLPNQSLLLFIGGSSNLKTNDKNLIWTYHSTTHQWSILESHHSPDLHRRLFSCILDPKNNLLYLFGGKNVSNTEEFFNDTCILDCNTKEWKILSLQTKPSARSGHTMVLDTSKNRILLYGGMFATKHMEEHGNAGKWKTEYFGDVWEFQLTSQQWKLLWQNSKSTSNEEPLPRERHTCIFFNQKMFIFGGWTRGQCCSTPTQLVWEFDPQQLQWKNHLIANSEELARFGASSCVLHQKYWIIVGGRNEKYKPHHSIVVFDLEAMTSVVQVNTTISLASPITTTSDSLHLLQHTYGTNINNTVVKQQPEVKDEEEKDEKEATNTTTTLIEDRLQQKEEHELLKIEGRATLKKPNRKPRTVQSIQQVLDSAEKDASISSVELPTYSKELEQQSEKATPKRLPIPFGMPPPQQEQQESSTTTEENTVVEEKPKKKIAGGVAMMPGLGMMDLANARNTLKKK